MTSPEPLDVVSEVPISVFDMPIFWAVFGLVGAGLLTIAGLLWALRQALKESRALAAERDAAIIDVRESATTRRTFRYHTKLLQILLSHEPSDVTLRQFLKMLVPRPTGGYAAMLRRDSGRYTTLCSRGQLPADAQLATLPMELHDDWNAGNELPDGFLVPVGSEYVLLASQLGPDDIDESGARQILQSCLYGLNDRTCDLCGTVAENDELRMSREKLALHEIAGRISEDPDAVVKNYLSTLLEYQSYDRLSLFLVTDNGGERVLSRIGQAGPNLHRGLEQTTGDHELAIATATDSDLKHFGRAELDAVGVESLVGEAMTIQLKRGSRVCGILCLTAAHQTVRDAPESRLIQWASRHLVVLLEALRDRVSMERRATRDGLTGLLNRAELDRRLASIDTQGGTAESPCSVILFDLDRFKNVNDTYGHAAGDEALRHVASIMQTVVLNSRSDDDLTVARYGGEELCILMPHAGLAAGLRIADEIRRQVASTPFSHDGRSIPLTISAGVATLPHHGNDVTQMMAAADASLYTSKQLGRNRVTDATSIQSLEAVKDSIQRRD